MAIPILITSGTLSEWEAKNPILRNGQLGLVLREDGVLESDLLKAGDNVTHWKDLPFMNRGQIGVGLEYIWDGTKLGIKRSDSESYSYVDLKGATGVGLEFLWNGTSLGVRREGGVYAYTNLVGPQGEQGVQGDKGDVGDKGDKGDTGEQGVQGIQGIQGEKGEQGDKGDVGEQGVQGVQGIQGEKGDKGDNGVGIPDGGTEGQLVAMGGDGSAKWTDPPSSLPSGGVSGQALIKLSDADLDVGWGSVSSDVPKLYDDLILSNFDVYGYWPLSDVSSDLIAHDLTQNANHGAYSTNTYITTLYKNIIPKGKGRASYLGANTSNVVTIPVPDLSSGFSISLWYLKYSSLSSYAVCASIDSNYTKLDPFFAIYVNNSAYNPTKTSLNVYSSASVLTNAIDKYEPTTSLPTLYHYVVSFDGQSQTGYINGEKIGTQTSTGQAYAALNTLMVGCGYYNRVPGSTNTCLGLYNGLALFTRAITDEEAFKLYAFGL